MHFTGVSRWNIGTRYMICFESRLKIHISKLSRNLFLFQLIPLDLVMGFVKYHLLYCHTIIIENGSR